MPQQCWPGPVTVQRMMQTTLHSLTDKIRVTSRGVVLQRFEKYLEFRESSMSIYLQIYDLRSETLIQIVNNVKTNELTNFAR